MKKNKYDLVDDMAWMISNAMMMCTGCLMKNECDKFRNKHKDEDIALCHNVNELTEAIKKKYNL